MSIFLRLISDKEKEEGLRIGCVAYRSNKCAQELFYVEPESFASIPTTPFPYWISNGVKQTFSKLPSLSDGKRSICVGLQTSEDFRFVRCWWEVVRDYEVWPLFAKGGQYSPFYADIHLVVKWENLGYEINTFEKAYVRNPETYFRKGLTWPHRTTSGLSFRILPEGCVYGHKGPSIFDDFESEEELLYTLGITTSLPFMALVDLQVAAADAAARSYDVGIMQRTPFPTAISESAVRSMADLARRAYFYRRTLDTVVENSHAFELPFLLTTRFSDLNLVAIKYELEKIQSEINTIAFDLYGFSEDDRAALQSSLGAGNDIDFEADSGEKDDESGEENSLSPIDDTAGLLSWTVGVSFGRFDWRLAIDEREVPPEPEPFDPLPAKSPGMLPDGADPFYHHAGILVDDEGHQHDLPRLIEQVLETVDAPVNQDIRRWLRKDFFPFHLQQYSKSRRKAPIYWPLSTASGSYTLWLYYPELTNQTLFTAVNDFLEGESGKLSLVKQDVAALRNKGSSRSKQEEKELEKLEDLERELADLRDTLLEIAPGYRPNQDDGVQITAAPLWSLFRHKPWQKVLKDTWKQLEKGDYDWAHLALNYWPDRVLRKCHEDRSLAIAHDVEEQFWEEVEVPVIRRGKDAGETKLEWQPKDLSEAQLQALINQVRQERSL